MKKILLWAGIIIGICAVLAIAGYYNSYVYNLYFYVALHGILSGIVNGGWQLISNSEDFPVIQNGIDTGHFKLIAERAKDKLVYVHSLNHLIG